MSGYLFSLLLILPLQAGQVELRLVVHDRPDTTVDKLERQRVMVNPVSTNQGVVMARAGIDYVGWGRNILLDGQTVFERYYEGKYIDRLPVARVDLRPGPHTVWPGDHVFTVAEDGRIEAKSPDLLAEGAVVLVKCYPVTLQAYRANPEEGDLPMSMRLLPLPNLTVRESANAEEGAPKIAGDPDKARDLLPLFDRFAPLTIWLPANKSGKGYLIHPLGLTFHLGAEGIVPAAGGGQGVEGLRIQAHRIEVPVFSFPVVGDANARAVVTGVESFAWDENSGGRTFLTHWYPRRDPYGFRVSEEGPALQMDGDLRRWPVKTLRVDIPDVVRKIPLGLVVEMESRHLTTGMPFRARIRGVHPAHPLEAARAFQRARGLFGDAARLFRTAQERSSSTGPALNAALDEAASKLKELPEAEAAERKSVLDGARAKTVIWVELLKKAQTDLSSASQALSAFETRLAEAAKTRAATSSWSELAAGLLDALKAGEACSSAVESSAQTYAPAGVALRALLDDVKRSPVQDALAKLVEAAQAWEASVAAFGNVPQKLTQSVESLRAAEAEARAPENLLADAPAFAQMRPMESDVWTDLTLEAAGPEEVQIIPPDLEAGVYRLRLGLRPPEPGSKPIAAEQWVSLASPQPASLGLFTLRGRRAYYRGESFWVGLAILALGTPVPPGTPLEADLRDEHGARFPLVREKLAKGVEKACTLIVRLDAPLTQCLSPGRYFLEARAGLRAARPLVFSITDPEPRTHFTNLMNGKYSVFNTLYERVLRSGQGADEAVRGLLGAGYNAFMGMSYDVNRVYRSDTDIEAIVRARPELGPWESYAQASGRDRFLDSAVRHNLRFYEDVFTYNDTMLPRDPKVLEACERYISLETASMRHSPAFHGVCLYDEIYTSADTGTAMSQGFFKAQEVAYRNLHPGMTSAEALRALDRYAGRPYGQRRYDDLARYRTWPAHEDRDWRLFSDLLAAAAKDVMPEAQNFTQQRFWGTNGGNLSPNGTASDVFASLDIAACVMYKDGGYGDRPVFAPMQADVLRVRDSIPVWTQLHGFGSPGLFGRHHLRQAFLALSQKIEGFTFFTIPFDPESPGYLDNRDAIRDITEHLCTPYGDFFLSLEKGYKKVAIYYSREADYLSPRKPRKLAAACEGLWVACLRAGFPADFLYDDQIRSGKGLEYQVVFAPGFFYEDEAPPETLAALSRLVDSGRTLAVERSSRLPLEGLARLDSDLDEYDTPYGNTVGFIDFESEAVWDHSSETTRCVREFLGKRIPPAAQHDRILGPDWLRCGQAEYLVVANFAFTGFHGVHKTLYQAPDCAVLKFPRRPPACYDLLEMKPIEVATEGDWMTLESDLRHVPGKIYAFLPAPIAGVELHAASRVPAGNDLNYRVSVRDAEGKAIEASFPIQVILRDSEGRVQTEVYRAAAPEFRGVYRVPVNVPAGAWTLRVRELVSGTAAEAAITVAPGTLPAAARLDARQVWISDPERILGFLAEKGPLVIAIDEEQAACRAQAERLRDALAQRGREARVAAVQDVLRLPMDWDPENPRIDGGRLWRGDEVLPALFIDAPLVLLGGRNENRLVEALIRRDLLAPPLTTHFPGPGKALMAWSRRAFSTLYDTVSVLAADEAGLARGVSALLELPTPAEAEPVHPPTLTPRSDPAATLVRAPSAPSAPSSFRDAVSGEDLVRSLDVDPATGRVLAGTFGYTHNLFCLSAEGRLLWKQFLPEHNVYFARWYDGGHRVAAATGQGFFLFLLRGDDGQVLKKSAATEWPRHHGGFNTYQEAAVNTELQIEINPPLRQILMGGLTGILAVDFDGNRMWFLDRAEAITAYPKEAEQSVAAEFGRFAVVGNFALSPDGLRLACSEERIIGSTPSTIPGKVANLWQHVPRVLDARTGQILIENRDDPGNQTSPGNWSVSWPADSAMPRVHTGGVSATLLLNGKLGPYESFKGILLRDGGRLHASPTAVERVDSRSVTMWREHGAQTWIPGLDALGEAQKRLYRCDRDGLVRCTDLETGRTLWEHRLPFSALLRPGGGGLVAGSKNGTVVQLDPSGVLLWQVRLRDLHETATGGYPAYLQSALERDPDSTGELFPANRDAPGDYDAILRMGIEQLENGDFESLEGWASAASEVKAGAPGHSGDRALVLVPGQLVSQRLRRRIVPSATYLLEFFYQVRQPAARLVAGALLGGPRGETLTASKFAARPGEWAFGRLAVKTLAETSTLDIGFEAEGGEVRVDGVSFRPVRFPSANLLAHSELHAVEPTFVQDLRVQYDRIPARLREKLMGRNRVAAFAQGLPTVGTIYTQEQAFLHNGRLDDVGPAWIHQPDYMGYSVILTQPAHISHLVIYLNNATPDQVCPTFSIQANVLKTRLPEVVALVRGNRRRFLVVHFAEPLHTDLLKILPGPYRALQEQVTEVEVYGPIGGIQLGRKDFPSDPDGWPMFMGVPSHAPERLAPDLIGEYAEFGNLRYTWPSFHAGATVVLGQYTCADAGGVFHSFLVPKAGAKPSALAWGPTWGLATVTPTTTPARYAGRLLAGSADYRLHAVADNGTPLWSFQTGGRVYSSPVPSGDDVYFGSDDGRLYKVDVDSGTLIWEFTTADRVRSAPALAGGRVYAASWDGFLYCLDAESGLLAWKSPIAPFTRSSPAVHDGRVILGDEQGRMLAFDAASGQALWQHPLGGNLSTCPVATTDSVCFFSDQGDAARIAPDGSVAWKRSLGVRVTGQPVPTQSQVLVPTERGLLVLTRSDGQPDSRFVPPPASSKLLAVLPYRGMVCVTAGFVGTNTNIPPRTYADYGGFQAVWGPKPAAEAK
ncbi:MAG: PQQ-binding-like beta-propeller repeat protein [Planctomycetes bacterium]|nr:PQQ-binding-like beta-propeller repeat protein [Planctomycetota bacterium]